MKNQLTSLRRGMGLSAALMLSFLPGNAQNYCTPSTTNNTYYIDNFNTIGGSTNINNVGSGYSTGGYGNFTATQTVTQMQGSSISYSGSFNTSSHGVKIWVDWNKNGSFADAGEEVYATSTYVSSFTGMITVPLTASPGTTRMRVASDWDNGSGPTDACSGVNNGEYEDYTFNVVALAPCTGTPSAGTMPATMSVCQGVGFTLAPTGVTLGTGMTYQWQSRSPSSTGTWTNIAGANAVTHTSIGIIDPTDYRLVVNCNLSTTSTNSNPIAVSLLPWNQCYCIPSTTSNIYYINAVTTTGGTVNINNTSAYSQGGYGNYTATQNVAQAQGSTIMLNAAYTGSTFGTKIWVDWNQNGSFSDPGEQVYVSSALASSISTPITVPSTATLGATRMRIGVNYLNSTGPFDPCASFMGGEYEDYTFTVTAAPSCATVSYSPNIHAIASPKNFCMTGNSNLSIDSTIPYASNATYQWQSAPSPTGPWTNVGTASASTTYTATGISATTYYRMQILCNGSPVMTTSIDTVKINAPALTAIGASRCGTGTVTLSASPSTPSNTINWYAAATGGAPLSTGNTFTTPSIAATTTYYAASIGSSSTYTTGKLTPVSTTSFGSFNDRGLVFNAITSFNLVSVDVYPIAATAGTGTITIALKNAAGTVLQSTTATVNTAPTGVLNTVPLNFTVPQGTGHRLVITAGTGLTGLVRENNTTNFTYPYTVPNVVSITSAYTTSPSSIYYYYFYKWVINSQCEGARTAVTATVNPLPVANLGNDTTICAGNTLTLNPNSGTGNTYLWSNGATTQTIAVTTAGTYWVKVTSAGGCFKTDTIVVNVKSSPTVNLGNDTAFCAGNALTLNAGNAGATYLWSSAATTQTIAVNASGTYWVKVTAANGCFKTDTIVVTVKSLPTVDSIIGTQVNNVYTFTAANPQNVATYSWNFGDNTTSTAVSPTHRFAIGTYTVTLTVRNACGSKTVTKRINKKTGVNDIKLSDSDLKVYPNPASHNLVVQNESVYKMESIQVYNIVGQMVMEIQKTNNRQETLNISRLASGTYNLRIQMDGGMVNRKFEIVK